MVKKPTKDKVPSTVARRRAGGSSPVAPSSKGVKSVAASALSTVSSRSRTDLVSSHGKKRRRTASMEDSVTLPRADYEALIETAEANKALRAYHATRDEESFPEEVVNAILDGANPIRVWREYRGLKQNELAAGIGVSKSHLSEVESGKGNLSVPVLSALADALEVDMEMLVPHPR